MRLMPSIISQLTAKNKIINELKISNMSNFGSNTFVIEGANGTEICNKIMKTSISVFHLLTRGFNHTILNWKMAICIFLKAGSIQLARWNITSEM